MYNFNTLTQVQKDAIAAVVAKYAHIAGDYEDTMLGGIVHAFCDSGISNDAFSVKDAETIALYFTEDAQAEGYLELFNSFIKEVTGEDLQCVQAINELTAITGDTEIAAAYVGKLTDSLMEHCFVD